MLPDAPARSSSDAKGPIGPFVVYTNAPVVAGLISGEGALKSGNWRTPVVVLVCSGIIVTLAMGTRSSFGLFLRPMTFDLGWNRETFAFAMALQNLILGAAAPFGGLIADRKGAGRVLMAGGGPRPAGGRCARPSLTRDSCWLPAAFLGGGSSSPS